jgi:alkanesulfonate monooxygenase SsuD/methylene tetrahydromethanopterin reductase-like flavin-dependent oxidoreductase (luciferase family)
MKIVCKSRTFPGPAALNPLRRGCAKQLLAADASGFSSLWVIDHFFQIQMIGSPDEPMLEAYSALNFLAGSPRT